MANFNTNQARHLYVASTNKDSLAGVTAVGDIYAGTTATGELYFVYKNGDGIVTRSDSIPAANVEYYNKKTYSEMAKKLLAHTVAVDTSAVTLSALVGKTVTCVIEVREYVSLSPADCIRVVAQVTGDATNTANATAFHKALAYAIAQAMPKREIPLFRIFSNGTEVTPSTALSNITGAAAGVVLVATPQKWIRGKMSNDPFNLVVSFSYSPDNMTDIAWGTDTVAASEISGYTTLSAAYEIADLEYFCLGERGDVYRGSMWPNNYEPTYMVNVASNYDLLTVQYFWQGHAENIQKSSRTLQIAGPTAVISALYEAVDAAVNGTGSGSGSGAGA